MFKCEYVFIYFVHLKSLFNYYKNVCVTFQVFKIGAAHKTVFVVDRVLHPVRTLNSTEIATERKTCKRGNNTTWQLGHTVILRKTLIFERYEILKNLNQDSRFTSFNRVPHTTAHLSCLQWQNMYALCKEQLKYLPELLLTDLAVFS